MNEHTVMRPDRRATPAPSVAVSLILTDGRVVALDAPAVLGRNPDQTLGAPGAVALVIEDPSMSKTHVGINITVTPDGGWLEVTDLHSRNGSSIDVGGGVQVCPPGEPLWLPIASGTLRLGDAIIEIRVSS